MIGMDSPWTVVYETELQKVEQMNHVGGFVLRSTQWGDGGALSESMVFVPVVIPDLLDVE